MITSRDILSKATELEAFAMKLTANNLMRAKELVHDTLSRAFEKMGQYPGTGLFTWLKNIMLDVFAESHHQEIALRPDMRHIMPTAEKFSEDDDIGGDWKDMFRNWMPMPSMTISRLAA